MLSKDSTPGREPVLDEIVVKLQHSRVRLLDHTVSRDEGGQLEKVKDHLNRNGEHLSWDLFTIHVVCRVQDLVDSEVISDGKVDAEGTVYEADYDERDQAVQTGVHYLLDRIDFDHAAVVGNVAAKSYVNYWAHETSDLEDNDCPALIVFVDNLG